MSKRRSPIHERIRALRIERDLTQEDVATATDVHVSAVNHWETGDSRPDVARIPALARVLGSSVEDLIAGDQKYLAILTALGGAS